MVERYTAGRRKIENYKNRKLTEKWKETKRDTQKDKISVSKTVESSKARH